jgi:tRNA(fMet)-specific endonuclease VapC
MRRLLDAGAYRALKQGHAEVTERVREATELVFSVIVLGELRFQFRTDARYQQNLAELHELLSHPFVHIADVTCATVERFERIAAGLKRTQRQLADNQVWIAAQAIEHGAELLTFCNHYSAIPGLQWTELSRDGTESILPPATDGTEEQPAEPQEDGPS